MLVGFLMDDVRRDPGGALALGAFSDAAFAFTPPRRNADSIERMNQWRLREYLRALVTAYGWRPDIEAPNRRSVPYVPAPFAGEMLAYFRRQARYWLGRSIPEGAKQPNFIRNRLAKAEQAATELEGAPAAVAAKAPAMFRADLPAGQPSDKVLTGPATIRFMDALTALAIHCDALGGQPTKLDLFVDAMGQTIAEIPERVAGGIEKLAKAPADLLTILAAVGLGLAALFVVTR